MGLNVIAPFGPSWNRMIAVLFRPFDIGRWFVLGFGAFLASLGEGGGGNFSNFGNWGSSDPSPDGAAIPQPMVDAHAWILGHWGWILAGALVLLPVLAAFWGVLTWLSSRGHFILLDNLLRNRAEIGGPWTAFKNEANSLFKWRFGVNMASAIIVWGPLLYGTWRLLDTAVAAREFTVDFWIIVLAMGAWFILAILSVVPFMLVLRDFVPVIQWHRRIPAGEALKVFWREVLPGNFWSLNLYYLWLAVLWIGAGVVMMIGICCTCCIGGLPYLSSVLFLPVLALFRLYPAYYLAQLGKGWELVETDRPDQPTPPPTATAQAAPAAGQTYTVTGVVQAPPLPPQAP